MARHRRSLPLLTVFTLAAVPAAAQEGATDIGKRLLERAAVGRAVDHARANEAKLLEDQIRLCEIPAPPFKEKARANAYRELFVELGLENVRIDEEGNVIGERPGSAAKPNLVLSAHLDTVFPEGTNVRVKREGTVLRGPGIGDDCRGLAVLIGVIRALNAAQMETVGTVTFVGTVGEEGLGDLRGVRHLFEKELKGRVDRFVSVDGAGLSITHVGVGSRRYRIAYTGPGGHSYGAFGAANPTHALGRAIAKIADFQVPREPKTTFNVGRVGGGTSVNSIAFEAWMEVDLRSPDPDSLAAVDARFIKAVDEALAEENARWANKGAIALDKKSVGDRPAGQTSEDSPLVQAAQSVTRALDLPVELAAGSTDANIPMSLGIPAITIDGGGEGAGTHSLDETFDTKDSWKGTARAVLLAIALSSR